MFIKTLTQSVKSLYSPREVFEESDYSKASTGTLLLFFYLLILATSFMGYMITNHEGIREFQVEMGVKQALKFNPAMSEEEVDMVREQIMTSMDSMMSRLFAMISLVFSAAMALFGSVLFFWAYMIIVLRFAGGEETPVTIEKRKGPKEKKHRSSYILSFYRYLPIAIGGIISTLILVTGSKEGLYNITSLEDMTRKMSVNLTLYALLFEGALPIWAESILNVFTSPFWWWSGWIAVEGMEKVWRLPYKKGVAVFAGWALLASLFTIGSQALTSFFTA